MSSDRGPVIYGLESQGRALTARTLTARAGETDNIQFLVGTQSLKHENQVHLLEYSEDTGVLDKTVYTHAPGEIWDLSSCPYDAGLVATVYGCVVEGRALSKASLWRLGKEDEEGPLEHVAHLELGERNVRCTAWHPGCSPQLVAVDDSNVSLIKLTESSAKVVSSVELGDKGRSCYSCLCWNPHGHSNQLLLSMDATIKTWDLRTANKLSLCVEGPHGPCVRGMDFNPNKPHYFSSCGDDCTVKFWDSRHLGSPLATRQDHSHWVWTVQYNLFHDQLVLSGSSDSRVVLTRMASIASEPLHALDDEDDPAERLPVLKDEVIARYEEHEDSVYRCVWSVADAWVFASLSFDGRVVINHVPSQEKFSILTS